MGPDWDLVTLDCANNGRNLIYFVTGATANRMTTTAMNMDTAMVIVAQDWLLDSPNWEDNCPPLPVPPSGWSAWGGCIANTDSFVLFGAACRG